MKTILKDKNTLIFSNDFCNWETGELLSPIETQNYLIMQVVESCYNNSFHINKHTQYCDLEIVFPITNGLLCGKDGAFEPIKKQEAYLLFRGETHEIISRTSCRFQTLAINFKQGPCFDIFKELQTRFHAVRKLAPPDISRFFTTIIAEFLDSDTLFSHSLDCSITALLVNLLRVGNTPRHEKLLSPQDALPEIMNYLDAHFLEICSVEELSRFGYTYNHICKVFKKTYGISPNNHLLSKKMEHAKLLLSQKKTLSEIAELLGYSSSYNFSRAFKKHFGIPPSAFLST